MCTTVVRSELFPSAHQDIPAACDQHIDPPDRDALLTFEAPYVKVETALMSITTPCSSNSVSSPLVCERSNRRNDDHTRQLTLA